MLNFRPLEQEDLPFLLEVRNECRGFLHDDRAFSLAECQAWFRDARPDFLMIEKDGERIGYIRLARPDDAHDSIEVGMDLHPKFRGLGLASRAYELLWPWLKEHRQASRVCLEVLSHNERAMSLYRKLGFVEVGRSLRHSLREGLAVDSIQMTRAL